MSRFDGKTVLVTGAASGIGYEMARQFRDEGARVYATDLHPDDVPEGTAGLCVDVTDADSVAALLARGGRDGASGRAVQQRGGLVHH